MVTSFKLKVLVDTNVLLDYLIPAREKHREALDLFSMILAGKIEAAFTTQSMLDAAYIAGRCPGFTERAFRNAVEELMNRTSVAGIDTFNLQDALGNPHPDLEDSAHIAFAYSQRCVIIVTHDKGILSRPIPKPMRAMTTDSFLAHCR